MVYKFLDKKSTAEPSFLERMGSDFKKLKNTIKSNDELHKPIINKFNKRNVYSQFKDNI